MLSNKYVKTIDNKIIDVTNYDVDIYGNYYQQEEDETFYIYANEIIAVADNPEKLERKMKNGK